MLGERIKGFLFSPSKTFDASKEDTLGDAFKYFVLLLAIYAVLFAIMVLVAFSAMSWMVGPWTAMLGLVAGPTLAIIMFVLLIIGGITGVFINGLWTHIWVYVVGGRGGVVQTIKAVMYGETPGCLLGWIPVVNIIASIWALIVEIVGIRQLHALSTGKAVLAVILAIIIPAIIIGAIIAAFIATMPRLEFGGY